MIDTFLRDIVTSHDVYGPIALDAARTVDRTSGLRSPLGALGSNCPAPDLRQFVSWFASLHRLPCCHFVELNTNSLFSPLFARAEIPRSHASLGLDVE
jgi:hypothetical protein